MKCQEILFMCLQEVFLCGWRTQMHWTPPSFDTKLMPILKRVAHWRACIWVFEVSGFKVNFVWAHILISWIRAISWSDVELFAICGWLAEQSNLSLNALVFSYWTTVLRRQKLQELHFFFSLKLSLVTVACLAIIKLHHARACEKWLILQWAFVLISYNWYESVPHCSQLETVLRTFLTVNNPTSTSTSSNYWLNHTNWALC